MAKKKAVARSSPKALTKTLSAAAGQSALDAKMAGRAADEALAQRSANNEMLSARMLEAATRYKDFQIGRFENIDSIRLGWIRSDRKKDWFEFIPRKVKPFAFIRHTGERIEPRRMFTDGGSVPRLLWSVSGYSPWGQGPAFLVHDYEFDAHHCGIGSKSFDEVTLTMMEAVKTLMESQLSHKDESTFHWIHAGISSNVARKAWDRTYPTCPLPPNVPE